MYAHSLFRGSPSQATKTSVTSEVSVQPKLGCTDTVALALPLGQLGQATAEEGSRLLCLRPLRGHYIATRCRNKIAVFSFYPRAIRIWNMIPPHIIEIENPIAFQAAIMNLPFPTPNHLNCL